MPSHRKHSANCWYFSWYFLISQHQNLVLVWPAAGNSMPAMETAGIEGLALLLEQALVNPAIVCQDHGVETLDWLRLRFSISMQCRKNTGDLGI